MRLVPLDTCNDIRTLYDEIVVNEIEEADRPDGEIFRKELLRYIVLLKRKSIVELRVKIKLLSIWRSFLNF